MSEDDRDEAIAARARRELDRQLESLDDATRVRLRAARLRALDAYDARPAWRESNQVPAAQPVRLDML